MGRYKKIFDKIMSTQADKNIDFQDVVSLMCSLGFQLRVKGSHHIFTREGILEIINIQANGNQAKAYQIRQIRNLILKYNLGDECE